MTELDPLITLPSILASMFVLGVIGMLIGASRGRNGEGFFWGLLLGPLGWCITLCQADIRPKCPECKGAVIEGATKCVHCGAALPSKDEHASFSPVSTEGAVVKGNGEVFGIAIVMPQVLADDVRAESYRDWLRDTFMEFASPRQIILAQREASGAVTYQGRSDLVSLLANTDPGRIPWGKIASTPPVATV